MQYLQQWKQTEFALRAKALNQVAKTLRSDKHNLAECITAEMGKPLRQSIAEIEKCAWVCEYYATNGQQHLADETIDLDGKDAVITSKPLGVIFAVMPWNFPMWQAFALASSGPACPSCSSSSRQLRSCHSPGLRAPFRTERGAGSLAKCRPATP